MKSNAWNQLIISLFGAVGRYQERQGYQGDRVGHGGGGGHSCGSGEVDWQRPNRREIYPYKMLPSQLTVSFAENTVLVEPIMHEIQHSVKSQSWVPENITVM